MRWTALLLGSGLFGCGPVSIEDLPPEVFALEPTYEGQVRPLFEHYCTSCHSGFGERAGGVQLDEYEPARDGRVKHVCVSVREEVVARFAKALTPYGRTGELARSACEGWDVGSMPTGARTHLTLEEQVILARWVETGGPR